ncbi:subtilisin-like protein, partial [Lepidopterella palustris CBS 459.81]
GASFVCRDGKESSWWLSQEMHGTNMARIIRSLDPYCELYIAQVGESKTDIRPERALREAIDRGVDVISMSFCFDKSDNALNEIIHEAHFKDIVTFASTADEGYNAKEAWPAKSHGVNAIAACTANGIWTEYTTGTTVTFALQGDGLTLPALSGAPSRTLRGSSVATAMAAGLGSLILACLRM